MIDDVDDPDSLGPLKTVSLDLARFRVPADWETGSDPGGPSWVASEDRRYAVERRSSAMPLPAGEADWRRWMVGYAADLLQGIGHGDIARRLDPAGLDRMLALQIPLSSTDKEGYAAWMWLNMVHRDGLIIKAVTLFYVALPFWHDDDVTDRLTALFSQAFTGIVPADPAAIGSPDRGFGLSTLRPIEPFGFIRFNVPARWYDEYDQNARMWIACEDEPDTGTLWIVADLQDDVGDRDFVDRRMEAAFRAVDAGRWLESGRRDRRLFYHRMDKADGGERAIFHRWVLGQQQGLRFLLLQVTFVVTADLGERAEFMALRDTFEREITAAEIGPLPARDQ